MPGILTSLHGRLLGLGSPPANAQDMPLICHGGFMAGRGGKQRFMGGPGSVEIWDDFIGNTIPITWASHKGSDGGAVDWAINVQNGGVVRGVTGAGAGVSMAANGIQLDSALNWKANQGGLAMEARVNAALITSLALFVGFTDQVSALEMPATISSGTLTTNFTDGAGFLFDTAATAATWKLVGVANDVDATMQEPVLPSTGAVFSPVAATFATFRVEIDTAGAATFFYNGAQIGTKMSGAVTPTVALSPVIAGFRRTATITQIDVDYIHVAAVRA